MSTPGTAWNAGATPGTRATTATRTALTFVRVGAGLLGVALVFSLWASPDRRSSLPWFAVAIVGVILVLVVTGRPLPAIARRVRPTHLLWFFLAAGFVTLVVTLLTSRWPAYKLSWLTSVYVALPSIRSLPLWWTQTGLQPNQTGGSLALVTAFAATVAGAPSLRRLYRWPAVFLTVAGFVVVFMTGSRAALAGLLLAVLLVAVLRTSRWLWAWGSGLVALLVALLASGQLTRIFHFFVYDETLDTKLVARLDIWSSALSGIQDHFLTGIGLGVFNQVMPTRYPYQTVGLSFPVSQAHNLFLDTALAIGLPGMIGLLLLLVGCVILAVQGLKQSDLIGAVSIGMLASIIVYLIFGVADSISLSIPTSFIIWLWVCALAIILQRVEMNQYVAC
ncbi:MAG: O-antigen ligase family protein [bacterium]